MNGLTTRQMRGLFYAIEINLLMWLAVAGRAWTSNVDPAVKYTTTAGFIVAALSQH